MEVARPTRWCEVAQALHHLSAGGNDIAPGHRRRRALHAIAGYRTTSRDLTRYFEEVGDHSSRELVDALLWCVGAVVMKAQIL
jgi:hypothetical protein